VPASLVLSNVISEAQIPLRNAGRLDDNHDPEPYTLGGSQEGVKLLPRGDLSKGNATVENIRENKDYDRPAKLARTINGERSDENRNEDHSEKGVGPGVVFGPIVASIVRGVCSADSH